MHFVSGRATVTPVDGEPIEVRAGVVLVAADGWHAMWDVQIVRRATTIAG